MGAVLKSVGQVLIAVLACASLIAAARGETRAAVQAGDVRFEELPPQSLERGRCGLFLWARTAQPVLLMAVVDEPSAARVRMDGSQRMLPRTRFDGAPAFGQFERQTFSDGRLTLEVDVQFDAERNIRDGAIVREGVVRVLSGGGWQTILPVGGLVACQT
jgi:hypothetical protein